METYEGVVIVTGGGQGIGEAVGRDLAARGATVVLADIQVDRAKKVALSIVAEGGKASAVYVDVADKQAVDAMVEAVHGEHDRIDGLVNNGGLDAQPGGWEIDEEHWKRLVDIDLSGQWWCTQAVIPHMVEQGGGRIVYVSSSSVYVGGADISVAYCAAKSGLIGLTVGLSSQLEKHDILVNCIMPGPTGTTGTPMNADEVPDYVQRHPLGFGGPQPVVDAIRFLLLPSGDWVSGTIMNVSGGRLRGR